MTQPPEPQPGDTLDARVGKLEAGQDSLSERVDRILGILDKKPDAPKEPVTSADQPPADMAEQMRQAVRDVHAERDQAAAKEPPKPEVPPREAGQPAKQRLARVLYGKDPAR